MPHVFTYGTLMFEPVWSRVVQGSYTSCSATLDGYCRYAVSGETYPGLLRQQGFSVAGLLYLDISDPDMLRLDHFEGESYCRETVKLEVNDGILEAVTYCFRPEHQHRLEQKEWDLEEFRQSGLSRFMQRYSGFGRVSS